MCERQRNSLAVLAKEGQVPKVGGTRCIVEGSVAGQVVASGDTGGCQELKAMPRPPSLGILGTAPHRRLVIGLPLSPSLLSVSPVLPQCRFPVPHTGLVPRCGPMGWATQCGVEQFFFIKSVTKRHLSHWRLFLFQAHFITLLGFGQGAEFCLVMDGVPSWLVLQDDVWI